MNKLENYKQSIQRVFSPYQIDCDEEKNEILITYNSSEPISYASFKWLSSLLGTEDINIFSEGSDEDGSVGYITIKNISV